MPLGNKVSEIIIGVGTEGTEKTASDLRRLSEMAKTFNTSTRRLATGMRELGLRVDKTGTLMRTRLGEAMDDVGQQTKELINSTKRFRAEWLSLLFVGMAISGIFQAYVSEGFNILGITELMKDAIGGAVAEFLEFLKLDEIVDKLVDFIDENQVLVGALALGGFLAGKLLTLLAMISLINFAQLGASVAGMATGLKAMLFAPSLFTILAVVVAGLFLAFDAIVDLLDPLASKFDKIASVIQIIAIVAGAILAIFFGWPALIIGVVVAAIAWLSKFEAVQKVALIIWDIIKNIGKAIGNFFVGGLNKLGFGLTPFAEGGVVTKPTAALIGERGPEAVIPLNRLSNFSPNVTVNANVSNQVDINRLADNIANIYSQQLRSIGIGRRL